MSLYENLKKVKEYNLKKRKFGKTLPKDKKRKKKIKTWMVVKKSCSFFRRRVDRNRCLGRIPFLFTN